MVKAAQDETATDNGTAGTAPTDTGAVTPSTGTETGTGGGGDTTGGGGDTTGGGTPQTGGGGTPKTAEFNYVLDVTFWANGRKRTIEGLKKLAMLPNQVAPLLIFMGVTDNAGNAVFLVDSTLKATGEGKCKPSHADCAFLYLGAGSEEEFTNADGDSYRLVINEIRKVKAGSQTAATTSSQKAGASARAAVGAPESARRFSVPDLTDLVVESTDGTDNSTRRRRAPIGGVWQCAVSSSSACSHCRPWRSAPPRPSRAPRPSRRSRASPRCASASATC